MQELNSSGYINMNSTLQNNGANIISGNKITNISPSKNLTPIAEDHKTITSGSNLFANTLDPALPAQWH
jgi:hypothetical protein